MLIVSVCQKNNKKTRCKKHFWYSSQQTFYQGKENFFSIVSGNVDTFDLNKYFFVTITNF